MTSSMVERVTYGEFMTREFAGRHEKGEEASSTRINVINGGNVIYAVPQAQRHSGAPRSGEPGIHGHKFLELNE
jgi:hypothetical protein